MIFFFSPKFSIKKRFPTKKFHYHDNIYCKTKTMAKSNTSSNSSVKLDKPKIKRPGVHSKTKTSKLKNSKNYQKKYVGQGK